MRISDRRGAALLVAGVLAWGGEARAQAADAERAPFPGMHLTEQAAVVLRTDRAARLISGLTPDRLFDLLAAGEWRTVQRLDIPRAELLARLGGPAAAAARTDDERQLARAAGEMMASSLRSYALLERGGERVLVTALGLEHTRAELVRLAREPFALTGPTPSVGQAWAYPFGMPPGGCVQMRDASEMHLLYEAPGGVLVRAQFRVPHRLGASVVTEEDENLSATELAVVRIAPTYIAAMAETLRHALEQQVRDALQRQADRAADAAGLVDTEDYDDLALDDESEDAAPEDDEYADLEDEPGVTLLLPTPGVRMFLTVRSLDPLQGEVRFEGLQDRNRSPYTLSAGFRCYHPSQVAAR